MEIEFSFDECVNVLPDKHYGIKIEKEEKARDHKAKPSL